MIYPAGVFKLIMRFYDVRKLFMEQLIVLRS